jgi:RNA polymerase sigma-70 factor (ECF subfamily)
MELEASDEDLVRDSSRDPDAFGLLYDRHARDVLGYFVRRTADAQVAADLTAEVFAAAFVARRRFRSMGSGSARGWLFGIARNQLGRYARRERVTERYRRKLGMERMVLSDDGAHRIEELAELADLRIALRHALASLPRTQLDAVRLRIIDELPYVEVALRLGCSEGAARVRVTRGLSRLAEVIGG